MKSLLLRNVTLVGVGRWFALVLALVLFSVLLFPGKANAHAILLRSNPSKDAVLKAPPSQVHLWFSENLNPTFSTAYGVNAAISAASTVTDTRTHVDLGNAHVSAHDPREMDLSLKVNLPPAIYAVIWRTQSAADGHILSGSFLFTVAAPHGTLPNLNGSQIPSGANGATTSVLDGPTTFSFLMVTLIDLGVVFWMGAQLWISFVSQRSEIDQLEEHAISQRAERRFERYFAVPTLLVLFLANVGVLVGQALILTGGVFSQAVAPSILAGLVTSGNFGAYWMMREIVIVLALVNAIGALLAKRPSPLITSFTTRANLVLGLALLLAVTLSGHAAAVSSNLVVWSMLVDWLHLLAASLWIGDVMYIATSYLPILGGMPLIERARSLLTTLPRYSPFAIAGVIIMTVTGPFNAVVHITTWEQVLTTPYGYTLVVKVLLVGALLLTSAMHVGLLRPRLKKDYQAYRKALEMAQPATSTESECLASVTAAPVNALEGQVVMQTRRLILILRWEPLLGVAVLICTGLLNAFAGTLLPATITPPVGQPAQPHPSTPTTSFSTAVRTSDQQFTVKLEVSPNRLGPNRFTVHVFTSTGARKTTIGVSLYTTMLDMAMGTDSLNLQPDGKGGFSGSGDFAMSGNWQIRIQIRTPDNSLHETTVKLFTPN